VHEEFRAAKRAGDPAWPADIRGEVVPIAQFRALQKVAIAARHWRKSHDGDGISMLHDALNQLDVVEGRYVG
jgi:hypothetical protein